MDLKIYCKNRNKDLHAMNANNYDSIEQAFKDAETYLAEGNIVWDKPLLGVLQGGKTK